MGISSRQCLNSRTPVLQKPIWVLAALLCVCLLHGPARCQVSNDYILGPEDVIAVTVLNHPEFSGEHFIPTDGKIYLPIGGTVSIAGHTLVESSKLISASLKSELRDPDVTVTLKSPRPQLVYVMGAVRQPGPYPVKPGWRLTEAVTAAGGTPFGIEAAECTVSVLRGTNGEKQSVSLQEAMKGSESANVSVRSGDVITVEAVELIPVYVMGKVARAGLYNIRSNSAGVLEAITVAGGAMDDAALSKVTVTHLDGASETISILPTTVEGKRETLVKLRSGDLVVVPDSMSRFAVLGWVNSPGYFPFKENQTITLSDALGMAHGVDNRRGGLKRVAILRTTGDTQERLVYNFETFARKGDITQNPVVRPGDIVWVPETDSVDLDRLLSRISTGLSLLWAVNR